MNQIWIRKIWILFLCLYFSVSFSQNNGIIKGQIVDLYLSKEIPDVVVSLVNTPLLQISDASGNFMFENIAGNSYILKIERAGFQTQLIPIDLEADATLDLGKIQLQEQIIRNKNIPIVSLSPEELQDDNYSDESVVFLQAQRDRFQQVAAFNFGPYRFRIRGLDNAYTTVLINGIKMNRFKDNRPQWNHWGGLNDITRNAEFSTGTRASAYTFGSLAGTQSFSTRASNFKKTTKISMAGANTLYDYRVMGTHASGVSKKGWAYVFSASKRWNEEGFVPGTSYNANSLFCSVEKQFSENHSLNFTGIYAHNNRAKQSYNTTEIEHLAGKNYNSYWGFQDGKKRNSRVRDINEPILQLSHFWKINSKTELNSTLSYQFGSQSDSRLDYTKANNPDPTYYKKLPSYYLTQYDANSQNIPDYTQAFNAFNSFSTNKQINWNSLYEANKQSNNQGSGSVYVLFADKNQDLNTTFNSILQTAITPNIQFQSGITYRKLTSENYRSLLDLLGGSYLVDRDAFLYGNQAQPDLNHINSQKQVGDRFRYNYKVTAQSFDVFSQFQFTYAKWDLYISQTATYTDYKRQGLYQNGLYPNNSLGNSDLISFQNFGSKVGALCKLNGSHFFEINAALLSKAPDLENSFSNVRLNNNIVNNLNTEQLTSIDMSYHLRTSHIKARATAYYTTIKNATNIAYYYTEGLGILTQNADQSTAYTNAFVSEVSTGINTSNVGIELSVDYKINSTCKAYGAANVGQYIFTNNPTLYLNNDNQQSQINLGKSYMKNYKQGGSPQKVYSVGFEYRAPTYWWANFNCNYLTNNYLQISPLLRTDNFFINPKDHSNFPFQNIDESLARQLLRQEKLPAIFTLNTNGGKSWKYRKQTLGIFVAVNNILNTQFKIGGFEQTRNGNYQEVVQDFSGNVRAFGPRYAYSQGRTYFINFYVRI